LVAYSYQEKKPALNLRREDLLPLLWELIPNSGYHKLIIIYWDAQNKLSQK
jgi:hypothetical protein